MTEHLSGNGRIATPPTVKAINQIFSRVQRSISDIADHFVDVRSARFDTVTLDQSDHEQIAAVLEPACQKALTGPMPRLIVGIGVVWVAAENASGMLWWRADNRVAARKYHIFNPASDSFYDYRNSTWYRDALQNEGLAIVGPYIDAWGTDDHTLTASMRMVGPSGLVGVAAADLDVQNVVEELDSVLCDLPNWVLVGAEDRVVASDVALLTPGLHLAPYLSKAQRRIVVSYPTNVEGWSLVQLN